MSQEVRGNDAPFILNAVERAIIRVPRSSHHGLTKIPTAVNIAGKTYLDLARLTDIDTRQLPQVVLAARLYHLAHTHRAMVITGQCALWAHGYGSDPVLPPITVATRSSIRPISIPSTTIGRHSFPSVTVKPTHVCHLPRADNARGLLVENLESAQITAARTSSNRRAAFTQMCMNTHAYTHFDNFHMKASRNNEESWKFFLERELKQLGNRARGRSQAQWIITHADAGCASPGEARVLYELCAADLTGAHTGRGAHEGPSLLHRLRVHGRESRHRVRRTSQIRGQRPQHPRVTFPRARAPTPPRSRGLAHHPRRLARSGASRRDHCAGPRGARSAPGVRRRESCRADGGICAMRSLPTACRRRVTLLMLQFPPTPISRPAPSPKRPRTPRPPHLALHW